MSNSVLSRYLRFTKIILLITLVTCVVVTPLIASGTAQAKPPDIPPGQVKKDDGNDSISYTRQIVMQDIDSGLTSPTGTYRWLDVADQAYSTDYRESYNYTQATVVVSYSHIGKRLGGMIIAQNLKPNFAYQIKLKGNPEDYPEANEGIGLVGRWWQEEWDGTDWVNGHNLNNKGDGISPNPNDVTYYALCDILDETSPTGKHYRFTGYLVFDYLTTDEYGNASLEFRLDSSYHVLFKTSQRPATSNDGPVKSYTFNPEVSAAELPTAYDFDYEESTIDIFGEWERLPVGGISMAKGSYHCSIMLTEESFHGSGGAYAGNWAAAMGGDITFRVK